jgi:exosome complex component RRP40
MFCVPGDEQKVTKSTKLGPGMIKSKESIIACKAGFLREEPGKMWIDSNQKRYVPSLNEPCIGIVVAKQAEVYKVDIGSAHLASLSIYGFEGARKSNRPTINTGALLYCRVTLANKDMEPEVECMTAEGLAKGFGELKGGYCVKTSLYLARRFPN